MKRKDLDKVFEEARRFVESLPAWLRSSDIEQRRRELCSGSRTDMEAAE